MSARRSLPWYSFLYRLLGAQGTFVLWILTLGALWWTGEAFAIRLQNRNPVDVELSAVGAAAGRLVRWVKLRGVEVTLDRTMLLAKESPSLAPVVLLLDAADPAAERWLELRRLVGEVEAGGARSEQAKQELRHRVVELLNSRDDGSWLPVPERAILVQDERMRAGLSTLAPAPRPVAGGIWQEWERDMEQLAGLVRERIRPDVVHEGLLLDTPPSVAARVKDELGVRVSPYLIQPGRQPRDLESVVFGAAAIVLILLAGGLWGAARVVVKNGA